MKHHPILKAASVAAFAVAVAIPAEVAAQQPAPPAWAGAYTLAQVDEVDLPVLLTEAEGCRREVTSATLSLQPDNRYRLDATVRQTCGETVEETSAVEEGSLEATGNDLTFTRDEKPVEPGETPAPFEIENLSTGTLDENGLSVKIAGQEKVFVFRR
jgi:hypothetical protein